MKILLREAFSESMPENIRKWMQQYGDSWRSKLRSNRAKTTRDFDPASAEFQDVSHLPVNTLREYLKAGTHVIFAEVDSPDVYRPVTVAIYSDSTNTSNRLRLIGDNSNVLREKSFKWIIEHSISVYATPIDMTVANVRNARYVARSGIISRDGDSAQSSDGRWSFDGADWHKDASGYWYDANRLSKKLAELHASDISYYYKKSSEIFVNMANTFADTIKSLAANPEELSFDTFGDSSFERLTRDGQRLLRDAGERMQRIKSEVDNYMDTIDAANERLAADGDEPWSEEEFQKYQRTVQRTIQRYFTEIKQKERELKELS